MSAYAPGLSYLNPSRTACLLINTGSSPRRHAGERGEPLCSTRKKENNLTQISLPPPPLNLKRERKAWTPHAPHRTSPLPISAGPKHLAGPQNRRSPVLIGASSHPSLPRHAVATGRVASAPIPREPRIRLSQTQRAPAVTDAAGEQRTRKTPRNSAQNHTGGKEAKRQNSACYTSAHAFRLSLED